MTQEDPLKRIEKVSRYIIEFLDRDDKRFCPPRYLKLDGYGAILSYPDPKMAGEYFSIEDARETIDKNHTRGIEKTHSQKLQIIYSVVEPYVEGLNTRLDSLKQIQELIISFTNSINTYFTNKTLEYHLTKGFTIKHIKTKESIKLNMLSSGERQLLLILCSIITTSEEATIFIIDEPEISLNVKWQRKIGDTLLEFAKGRNVQFILATHSIELLTGHKENVCHLINEKL